MPITIELDSIREACPVAVDDSVVHKNVYRKLARSIAEIYSRIPRSESTYNESAFRTFRTHDVIGVFGKRGTGKTTVLLSVLEDIQMGNSASKLHSVWQNELQGAGHVFADSIVPLPVVDPTMMGSKEHMLLRVVNLIRSCVEKHVELESAQRPGCAEWGAALRRLVQGIVNLEVAGEARQEFFYDEFAASEKMNAIVHVEDLERNFTDFIRQSLQLLSKEAFVLGIDDMDTNPSAAWASLECIRKYFTSPRLIVLLGGDLDMFTEIIRAEQRKFFDFRPSEVLGNFDSRPQAHVETLVEQYLLKLIPMLHRMELHTFLWSVREELDQYDIYDQLIIKRFDKEHPFAELVQQYHWDWGLHLSVLKQAYNNVLLDTPLRTAREIFNCLVESYAQPCSDDERTPKRRRAEMVRGLARIFSNALYQFGYADAAQELQSLETPQGIVDLLDKLVLHRLLQINNDDLHPRQHPQWLNSSLMVVQGALAHSLRNAPGVAFHYLLKISVFKELAQRQNLLTVTGEGYRALRDSLRLGDGITLSDTGKYLAGLAPCLADTQGYACGLGTVLVDVPAMYTAFPGWGTLYPLLGIYQRHFPAGTTPAFSIWSFLGLLGDVLLAPNDMLMEEVVRALPYPQTIASQNSNKEQMLHRPQEFFPEGTLKPDTDSEKVSERSAGVKALLTLWRADVCQWLEEQGNHTVPAGLFPRIAQRYVSSLHALDQHREDMNAQDYAAFYSKNCALLFLHAVLVEESRLVTNTSPLRSLSLADPINIEGNFIHNCTMVRQIVSTRDACFITMMPLFALCCTYPLWPLLLGHHLTNNMLNSLGLVGHCQYASLRASTRDPRFIRAAEGVLQELHNTQSDIFACSPHASPEEDRTEERWFRKLNLQAASFPGAAKHR